MDTLVPISRDAMRQLKAQNDEEKRIALEMTRLSEIKRIVRDIYSRAITVAKNTDILSYNYSIPEDYAREESSVVHPSQSRTFHTTNMADILKGVRDLFPGCSVLNARFARGQDGQMYDTSRMDVKMIPFLNTQLFKAYITVDWS